MNASAHHDGMSHWGAQAARQALRYALCLGGLAIAYLLVVGLLAVSSGHGGGWTLLMMAPVTGLLQSVMHFIPALIAALLVYAVHALVLRRERLTKMPSLGIILARAAALCAVLFAFHEAIAQWRNPLSGVFLRAEAPWLMPMSVLWAAMLEAWAARKEAAHPSNQVRANV
jgi:hypothetical protein